MSRISDAWEDRAIELLKTAAVEELIALYPMTRGVADGGACHKPQEPRQPLPQPAPTETASWPETPKDEAPVARGEVSGVKPAEKSALDDFEARFEAIKKQGR